jgi:hypothetical protein
MSLVEITRLKGYELNTPAGVGAASTDIDVVKADGSAIGVAVAENYQRTDLAQMYLTLESSNNKRLVKIPLTLLLPDGERYYTPLPVPFEVGERVNATIESKSANSAAANPIVLVFYHANETQQ